MGSLELDVSTVAEEDVEVVAVSPAVEAEVAAQRRPNFEDDAATIVDESCCEMKEMVNHFNIDLLHEAMPFLATLPDSVLDPTGLMPYLRQYTTARDALPWTSGGDEDWSSFRNSMLQYINGTHG